MSRLQTLSNKVREYRRSLDTEAGEARVIAARAKDLKASVAELSDNVHVLDQVTGFLNSLAEDKQQAAQDTIEGIVTKGLQVVFDPSLSFHISQTVRGKTANVDFFVRTTIGDEVTDTGVMEDRGGGLAAVIGFLLRVTVLLLDKTPGSNKTLVLDETFAHVSADYLEPLGEFIQELVEKTDVQVIMVTHQTEFLEYATNVYRFSTVNGATQVKEVSL